MLNLKYSITAEKTLTEVSLFIDSVNTEGSGKRWKDRFHLKILRYAQSNIIYNSCRYEEYAVKGFSCISIGDWIVVFKIKNGNFLVQYIILGSNFK